MSAPQHPAETPVWTAPPPGRPSRTRWRGRVVVVVVLATAAALVAGAVLRDDPTAADSQSPDSQPAEALPVDPGEEPGVAAEPPVDPMLAELRATDRYVAFAEHERAAAAVAAGVVAFGWNKFAIIHDKEVTHEWTNKAELWDAIAPPLRDELLLLGEPYTEPMWDEDNPSHTSIRASWPNESTGGRGQYVEVSGRYYDQGRDKPVELNWAVLIATHADGSGEIVARMPPVELTPSQANGFRHARELVSIAAWQWVQAQPLLKEEVKEEGA